MDIYNAGVDDVTFTGLTAYLLFQSAFESDVAMLPMTQPLNVTTSFQPIEGSDLGYDWPMNIRGSTLSYCHHIINAGGDPVADLNDYFDTHIETVTGHDGLPTKALYQSLTQSATEITQSWYRLYYASPSAVSDEDTYVKYWMKFPDDINIGASGWRSVFFWKTESTDYRVEAYVYRNANNNNEPYFYIQGDKFTTISGDYEQDWEAYSFDIPVPIGEWFKMEFFWHRSTGDDGRIHWAVNDEVVANRYGPNYGDYNRHIEQIALFGIYGWPEAYPAEQWIDDVEVWDAPPTPE